MPDSDPDTKAPGAAFDPQSESFAQNPYAAYSVLRSKDEPYFYEGVGGWLLSRNVDVEKAARDSRLVRSLEAFMCVEDIAEEKRKSNWHDMPNHSRFVQFSLLDSDGDVHFRLRLLVLRELSRNFVERQREMIQCYVDSLLDRLLERREIDFVADLASHVPGHIIGNVLGVPDEDCPQLRIWSENVVQFFDVARTEEHKLLAEQATTDFYHYLLDLIAQRKRQPKEDLVSTLIAANSAGELSETELISTCMLILMAGHGSTIDVLGSGMHALLRYPDELVRLRQNPAYIHTAVQEMFRFESPLPYFHRYATEEIEVMGRRYPKGTKFGLLYGSANRDPNQFPSADRFDIARTPNRHIAFGRGAHLCLGNHLSRLDMEVIFLTLMKRVKTIALLEDEPKYKKGLSVRGPQSLRILLAAA